MLKNRTASVVGLLLATVMAAACSGGPAGVSPVGPTALAGASVSGTTHNSTSSDIVDRTQRVVDTSVLAAWAARGGGWETEAEGTDLITAVSGICPDRVITISGVPGTLDSNTVYLQGLSCAALAQGMTVFTKGSFSFAPSFLYDIDEICVANPAVPFVCVDFVPPPPPPNGDYEEVTGTVASLKGTCPWVSMVVNGTRVTTSGDTVWEGGSCSDLRPGGTKVVVEGTLQPDGKLDALVVRITDQPGRK